MRLLVTLLLLAWPAAAQMPAGPDDAERVIPGRRDGFITDAERGCWVWVGNLPGNATDLAVRWSGACPNGPADGPGRSVIVWREGPQRLGMIYDGPLRRGKSEGRGALAHLRNGEVVLTEAGDYVDDQLVSGRLEVIVNGEVYEGALRNGRPHGPGTLRLGSAQVEGEWRDGCLRVPDGRWIGFMRSAEGCRGKES